MSRGRGVSQGSAHRQAEVDPASKGCQGRQGKGAGGGGGRGEDRNGRQRAEVPDQVTITGEPSTVGSRTAERFGRRRKGELQPAARTVQRPGAAVPASTTAAQKAGRGTAAALACSLATKCNHARRPGGGEGQRSMWK